MDKQILDYIREDVKELKGSLVEIDKKIDALEGKFVTKDIFDILKNTVITIIVVALGYLGVDINGK